MKLCIAKKNTDLYKKAKFIKKQKANGLMSSLGIEIPLNKTPWLGNVLF